MNNHERIKAAETREVDPRDWDRTHDGAPDEMCNTSGAPVELGPEHRAVIAMLGEAGECGITLDDAHHAVESARSFPVARDAVVRIAREIRHGGFPVIERDQRLVMAATEEDLAHHIAELRDSEARSREAWAREIGALEATRARLYPAEPTNG